MSRNLKIQKIRSLVDGGVLRELCPVGNGLGDVAYWHYEVVSLAGLPSEFHAEYHEFGEIRW